MKKQISNEITSDIKITRKQAIKKAGLVTLTTASMILLLKSPAHAATSTPPPPPIW
jgi:hypothetical protein